MKTLLFSLIVVQFLVANTVLADAKELCSRSNETWDEDKCVTTASASSVATGSGIYAAKKYSEADSIEKQFTQKIFPGSKDVGIDASSISQVTQSFTNGDKITIGYRLSEAANRKYHIDLMESNASSSTASAQMHEMMALTATKMEYDYDDKGNIKSSRTVADWGARATHALMASSARADAAEYSSKAAKARQGGSVPIYDFDKVVASKASTLQLTKEFLQEQIDSGGSITKITRLPVEKFNLAKSVINKGRGGLVGVAIGLGIAAEETVEGAAAKHIRKTEFIPKIKNYISTGKQ